MLGIGWGWDRWARALFAAAVCAPAFAAFVLYAAIFGRLFPLVEYRSWLDNRGLSLWDVIYSAFGWSETYYRTVPHYLISVMARFCDAPICGNLILLFVMCAGLALMAFAIGVLAEWRGPGSIAAAATFAAFSE